MQLSVIIASYNTKELLQDCLSSLYNSIKHSTLIDYEVIIVDNHSKDDSIAMVKGLFPRTKIIQNKFNVGFGKANNQGIKISKGKYILLLNSDTLLNKNSINNSLMFIQKDVNIGVVGCQLLNKDGTIQRSAGYFPTISRVFLWMFFIDDLPIINQYIKSYHISNLEFFTKNQVVDWVTGAYFLARREVFTNNYFDPNIFMYTEEVELCMRIKKKGWKIMYTPEAAAIHYQSMSNRGYTNLYDELLGLEYLYSKNYPTIYRIALKYLLRTGALLRYVIFGIIGTSEAKRQVYYRYFKMAR